MSTIRSVTCLVSLAALSINAVYGAIIISALLVGKVRLPFAIRRTNSPKGL